MADKDFQLVSVIDGRLSEAVKVKVRLSSLEGHIYVDPKSGKVLIKAAGYFKLNQFARISVLKPDNMMFNGDVVGNPYKFYGNDGNLMGEAVKAIGIGYVMSGGIVICQHTAIYNDNIELVAKLLTCIEDYPQSGFMVSSEDEMPPAITYMVGNKLRKFDTADTQWVYYPLGVHLGGIRYDIRNPQISMIMRNHWETRRNIDATMNTLVTKHILKNHPAIGIDTVADVSQETSENNTKYIAGYVHMYMWKKSLTQQRINELYEYVIAGNTFVGEDVKLIDGIITYTNDDENDPSIAENVTLPDKKETIVIVDDASAKDRLIKVIKNNAGQFLGDLPDKPIYDMSVAELEQYIKGEIRLKSIKTIFIDGLKCLTNKTFAVGTHNLVIDENGRGKTALLEAVAIITTGSDPILVNTPGAKSSMSEIVGLIPEDKDTLTIRAEYRSGEIIQREYVKSGDKNKQIITINGVRKKTNDGEREISELFGDFMLSFNVSNYASLPQNIKRSELFTRFGDKLANVDDDLKQSCRFRLLQAAEEYDGVLKYAYGVTSPTELLQDKKDEFEKAVIAKLPVVLQERYSHITGKILPLIVTSDIREYMNDVCAAVRTYKNDATQELQSLKKSLDTDRLQWDDSLDALKLDAELKKEKAELEKFLHGKREYSNYLEKKALYDRALETINRDKMVDIPALEKAKAGITKELASLKIAYQQYEGVSLKPHEEAKAAQSRISEMEAKLKDISDSLDEYKEKLKEYTKVRKEAMEAMTVLQGKLDIGIVSLNKIKETQIDTVVKLSDAKSKLAANNSTISQFVGGICPVCKTPVEGITLDIASLKKESSTMESEVNKLEGIKEKNSLAIGKENKEVTRLGDEKTQLSRDVWSAEANLEGVNNAIAAMEIEMVSLKSDIKAAGKPKYNAVEHEKLLGVLAATKEQHDTYIEKQVELDRTIAEIASGKEHNSILKEKRESMTEPDRLAYDSSVDQNITVAEENIVKLEDTLKLAYEARGLQKKIQDLENKIIREEAGVIYLRRATDLIDAYKTELIDLLLAPVEQRAREIYFIVFGTKLIFDTERCGVEDSGRYIPLKYLSGAQKVTFVAALLGSIMESTNAKTRTLAIEASELDDGPLEALLDALSRLDSDNIFVATYPRKMLNLDGVSDKWTKIVI